MMSNLKYSRLHQDNRKIVNRQESNNRIVRKKTHENKYYQCHCLSPHLNSLGGSLFNFTDICDHFFSQKFTINTCELKQGQVLSCPRGRGHQQTQIRDGRKHWDKVKSCFHHCQFPWFVASRHAWLLLCGSFCTSWAESPQCYSACHLDVTNLPSCR